MLTFLAKLHIRMATAACLPSASPTCMPKIAASRAIAPSGVPLGEGGIDWKGQIRALAEDGYKGWISLETHWGGPGGDKHAASVICGQNLQAFTA